MRGCFVQKSFRPVQNVALVALLGTVLSLLSGCVYLRLLEVKKQLMDFDANFKISGLSELVIEFKNPVIRTKDLRFLIGADPLSVSGEDEVRQHYEFEMVRHATEVALPPLGRLSVDLAVQRGKMTKIIVPETFMLLFPRNVIVDTLKQAKNAEVFELKKIARGRIHLDQEVEAELPSRSKTEMLLGPPLESAMLDDQDVLTYRYTIPNAPRDILILTQLSFSRDGLLRKVFVHWDQSSIEALFLRE
ncbi:MAG: hypothetical protein IPN90_05075 [Elusimicrobia bacterium]|nr:hypothetical protein [Elusimicrobiota bacterium]